MGAWDYMTEFPLEEFGQSNGQSACGFDPPLSSGYEFPLESNTYRLYVP